MTNQTEMATLIRNSVNSNAALVPVLGNGQISAAVRSRRGKPCVVKPFSRQSMGSTLAGNGGRQAAEADTIETFIDGAQSLTKDVLLCLLPAGSRT